MFTRPNTANATPARATAAEGAARRLRRPGRQVDRRSSSAGRHAFHPFGHDPADAAGSGLSQPEHRPDQRRCRDEQDDDRLEHLHHVHRSAGDGLHVRRPGVQRAEQQPGEHHAARPAEPEQRDRDRVDAVGPVIWKFSVKSVPWTSHGAARGPASAAGDQHHQHPVPFHVDARHARGRVGVRADGCATRNRSWSGSAATRCRRAGQREQETEVDPQGAAPKRCGRCASPAMAAVTRCWCGGPASGRGRRAGRPGSRP